MRLSQHFYTKLTNFEQRFILSLSFLHRVPIFSLSRHYLFFIFIMSLSFIYYVTIFSLLCPYLFFILSLSFLYYFPIISLSCPYLFFIMSLSFLIMSLTHIYHVPNFSWTFPQNASNVMKQLRVRSFHRFPSVSK